MKDNLYDIIQKQLTVYKNNKNIENLPKIYCIKCEEILELVSSRLSSNINVLKLEQNEVNNGCVFKADFGYGSSHDMSSYYMGICDKCTTDLYKRNLITSFKELSGKMNDVL